MFARWKRKGFVELFGKHVSPALVRRLASGKYESKLNEPDSGRIEYVLAAVRGKSPGEIGRNMGQVADVAVECGWMVQTLVSGVVLAISGPFPWEGDDPALPRAALLTKLRDLLGPNLKTVHGWDNGQFGSFGSPRRQVWGALLPSFLSALCTLAQGQFGRDIDKSAG